MPKGENSGGPNGGGRPKGSKNKLPVEVALTAAAEGISSVQAMLKGMRYYLDKGLLDKALPFAQAAALTRG